MGEVRLSPPITILTLLAGAISWMANVGSAVHERVEGCSVAAAFVDHLQNKPDVFIGPPLVMAMTDSEAKERLRLLPDTPDYQSSAKLLLDTSSEKPIDPLAACPRLFKKLDDMGIAHNSAAVKIALNYTSAKVKSPDRPLYVLAMRLPLVSDDKNIAIVEFTLSYAGYKSGETLLMRKNADGRWVESLKLRSWLT